MKTPALLAILDGVGLCSSYEGNALKQAKAPLLQRLFDEASPAFASLGASGPDVGLPEGQMGNSEVGHLTIGAGRVVAQELTRIDQAIEDGSFYQNTALVNAIDAAREARTTLHVLGLLSSGGVHSSQRHLEALLTLAARRGALRVCVHVFLDGRDVAPTSGACALRRLGSFINQLVGEHLGLDLRVGSLCGRYYAMDRDQRWSRVETAWRALTVPFEPDVNTVFANEDPVALLEASYARGVTDEFFEPLALGEDGIVEGDSLLFFNFRPDRARELTRAFIDPHFERYAFARPQRPHVHFVCMTEYDPLFAAEFGAAVAFAKEFPHNTLAAYLANQGLRQLHIAETEKYAHVTFFFNGGVEEPKPGEERILIPSPPVATYDMQPQMSAPEVSEALARAIGDNAAEVYIVNYANGDMVGHTGSLPATIAALEAVDRGLSQVLGALEEQGGVALITADHGNAEQMLAEGGSPWTAHTLCRVPLAVVDFSADAPRVLKRREDASLADIAPTLLDLMELSVPQEFTGTSLLA